MDTLRAATIVNDGFTGLVVFLVLGVAVFFLLRSFLGHVRRLPPSFDEPGEPGATSLPAPRDQG